MTEDAKKLLFIIAYAGSDAGKNALDEFLIELRGLRKVADKANDLVDAANGEELVGPVVPALRRVEHALLDIGLRVERDAPPEQSSNTREDGNG